MCKKTTDTGKKGLQWHYTNLSHHKRQFSLCLHVWYLDCPWSLLHWEQMSIHCHRIYMCSVDPGIIIITNVCYANRQHEILQNVKTIRTYIHVYTRSSAMAEGLHDALVSIEKSLQGWMTDIHPRSSQLLLLNGGMTYHILFVDCCFNVFISRTVQVNVTFRTTSCLTTKLKLKPTYAF